MDINREIQNARFALEEQRRQTARQEAQQRREKDALQAQLNEIGRKFVKWARESGTAPTEVAHRPVPGATPVRVGRRRDKQYRTPTYEFGTWVFQSYTTTSERGFGEDRYVHVILGIDQDGVVTWDESRLGPASVRGLMQYLVNFIARQDTTTPWPD